MPAPPLDQAALLDTVDGDAAFLKTLINTFLEDCPVYLDGIRTAVEAEDPAALAQEAHGLKGAVGLLHAEPTRKAAQRLEEIGRSSTLRKAPAALDALEDELDRLRPALRAMVEESESRS